jgi:peptidoglycan hydrolase-like protein with peptidoglycan-binding domain
MPLQYPQSYYYNNTPEPVAAYDPAPVGVTGDVVSNVQRVLKSRRFYFGPIDGVSGPATRASIRAYDAAAGLPVTGIIDTNLLASLRLM